MLKSKKVTIPIIVLSIIMIVISSMILKNKEQEYQKIVNESIAEIVGKIKEEYPNVKEEEIIKILNKSNEGKSEGQKVLQKYGIDIKENPAIEAMENQEQEIMIINVVSIGVSVILLLIIVNIYYHSRNKKIQEIIKYIEAINNKNYDLKIAENIEEDLSNFRNELYKIAVMLKEQASQSINDKKALQTSLEDISHQLKTPLTSISIMLDNIRENPNMDEHTRQEFIYEISRQINWINWLVISLLKLSKLDSNTAVFVQKEIKVEDLINNVVKNLAIPIDIKQQNVIVNGSSDVMFVGDYNWQLEALTNIVKNCIEHTVENKNIYINWEENNFYTKIAIKDEGVGIDKKDVKHIFERFYKGKNSSENSVGIGLALAKSIIEKDNGYIICASELGRGTTFEIKYMKP